MGKLRPLHWPYATSGGGPAGPGFSCFEELSMELAARSFLKAWYEVLRVWQTPALSLTSGATWSNHFTSLNLSFLLHKMQTVLVPI